MKHHAPKTALILYCLFIASIIILADLGKLPFHLLVKIPHYDWMAHLVLYGLLYSLLHSVFKDHNRGLFGSQALIITSSVIILEEISQLFLASRTFSFMDIFMGFSGIFLLFPSMTMICRIRMIRDLKKFQKFLLQEFQGRPIK